MIDLIKLQSLLKEKEELDILIKAERKTIYQTLFDADEFALVEETQTPFSAQLIRNSPRRSIKYSKMEKDIPIIYKQLLRGGFITISESKEEYKLVIKKKKEK